MPDNEKKKNLISNKSFETEQFTTGVSCIYIGRIAWYNKIKYNKD